MFLKIEFSKYLTIKMLSDHQSQGAKWLMMDYNRSLVATLLFLYENEICGFLLEVCQWGTTAVAAQMTV